MQEFEAMLVKAAISFLVGKIVKDPVTALALEADLTAVVDAKLNLVPPSM